MRELLAGRSVLVLEAGKQTLGRLVTRPPEVACHPATSTSTQRPACRSESDLEPGREPPIVCFLVLELHVPEVRPLERGHVVLRHESDAEPAELPVEPRAVVERRVRRAARC